MKKSFIIIAGALLIYSCDVNQVLQTTNEILNTEPGEAPLTNGEVISGLKSALDVGIENATSLTSKEDGFFTNELIKIAFPPDAIAVKEKVEQVGFKPQVDKFVLTMNRAAEEASKEAKPIFIQAIKEMSIADGFAILNGNDSAATQYLKDKTTSKLIDAFSPKVGSAIDKVELTKYWEPITTKYNMVTALTGGQTITTDLNAYITEKAVDGLFTMMTAEEKKIRENPAARVNDILKKVFGSLDK